MIFDLIAQQIDLQLLDRFAQQRHREVADPDIPCPTGRPHRFQRPQGLGQRNARIGPMDQQQIDIIRAQPAQAVGGRSRQIGAGKLVIPNLGGQKNVASVDARFGDRLPHPGLVVIGLSGIDMPVAQIQRGAHDPVARRSFQLPGSQTQRGHPRALDRDMMHGSPRIP
jgi:hypothetical protein